MSKYHIAILLSVTCSALLACSPDSSRDHTNLVPISKAALEKKFSEELYGLSDGALLEYACDAGIAEPKIGATQSCYATSPRAGKFHYIARITAVENNGDFSIYLDVPPEYTPPSVPPLPTGMK